MFVLEETYGGICVELRKFRCFSLRLWSTLRGKVWLEFCVVFIRNYFKSLCPRSFSLRTLWFLIARGVGASRGESEIIGRLGPYTFRNPETLLDHSPPPRPLGYETKLSIFQNKIVLQFIFFPPLSPCSLAPFLVFYFFFWDPWWRHNPRRGRFSVCVS